MLPQPYPRPLFHLFPTNSRSAGLTWHPEDPFPFAMERSRLICEGSESNRRIGYENALSNLQLRLAKQIAIFLQNILSHCLTTKQWAGSIDSRRRSDLIRTRIHLPKPDYIIQQSGRPLCSLNPIREHFSICFPQIEGLPD
ncbi:hypothetical protein CDAR_232431 [Caerostris darwini]|uniref:Uncharacterized protein n=1 Tax=Caerostris darwini TaxID=1538125 RepID=A0AAV4W9P2_9ARAC|nr:hypothetical protein CDAR_232431 [Caerostris darwini]